MLEQSTMHPVVWINQHTYISIVKNADYNLEVIYRLFPQIDLIQIHKIQKKLNPYFDLEV